MTARPAGNVVAELVDLRGRPLGSARILWWSDGAGQWAVRVTSEPGSVADEAASGAAGGASQKPTRPVASGDVAGPVAPGDVAGPVASGDVAGPVAPGDVAGPVASGDVAGPVASGDVAGPVASGDVAGPVASGDVECTGFDLWAALRAVRLELERRQVLLCIQAACLNVWPAHQSRASGSGTRAFRYAAAGKPGEEQVVELFAPASVELLGRVAEQEEVALERQRRFTLDHLARDAHRH